MLLSTDRAVHSIVQTSADPVESRPLNLYRHTSISVFIFVIACLHIWFNSNALCVYRHRQWLWIDFRV